MLRLLMGRHPYHDLHDMQPRQLRAACEADCLQLGRQLLVGRQQFGAMADAVRLAERVLRTGRQAA
jgi:5-methylthioribose kinase